MFWVVMVSMGLGCSEEAPVEEASWAALERNVSPGTPVVPDPWPDGMWMSAPIVSDLDGDGWVDLLGGQPGACLSGPYACGNPATAVYVNSVLAVWRGGPAGFPAAPTFQVTTPAPIRYAHPSAVVGDTDGDGVTEVLVADPSWDGDRGKVWLAAATPTLRPPQWTLEGSASGMLLGGAVEPLGDANGDGYDDLMLGVRDEGAVGVFYGGPGGFGAAPDWTSGPLADNAGTGLAAGDVDGDGYPDAFVGAPQAWGDESVFGFRGGPGGFGTTPDWTLSRAQVGYDIAEFGYQLLVVPDLNGDGYRELVVSAPGAREVAVFEGGPAGPATTPTWTYTADGYGLAAGDVDGDGRTDLLMLHNIVGTDVVLGAPGGLSPTVAYTMSWPASWPAGSQCFFGVGVSGDADNFEHAVQVADVDRDGRDDVVFACLTHSPLDGSSEGSTWVAYGGLDTDGDAAPDAVDCAPTDPAIYPGATETWYDGIDQGCDGGDDFDQDGDGVQALPWGLDEDDSDPDVTLSLVVSGSCAVSLDLAVDGAAAGATVEVYRGRGALSGSFGVPDPNPCQYARLQLNPPTFLASAVADGSGHAVLTGVAPWPTACTDRVQALDLSTCTKSTAHTTPP